MELLHREMFATPGNLTAAAPGANFSQVVGTLHQRPGGPRLADGTPASADLRGEGTASYGRYIFASQANQKLFVGGWFLIKPGQGNNVDLLNVSDALGNPSPTISISNGQLGGGIRYGSFTPAGPDYKNRWIFLGIATHLKAETTADVRFYYKLPGQPMQSWAPIDNGQIGIATMGQSNAGFISFDSTFKGRLGAPSVYTFTEDDFSDISYPSDLIEPASRLTWYCDPLNGSDLADGTTPETAWKTAAKINEESLHTGILPANSHEEGDTLVINTGGKDLDLDGVALKISTPGLNVRAAPGQEWIRIKSYRSLPPGVWQPTGTPNVYSTTDTQTSIVVWEDDKFMNHPLGASFAAVQAQLSSTPGSFWTDGTTLYVHPFGSTDPRADGKRYERSYNLAGAAFDLNAPNLNVQDIHVGKTCLANWVNNDPIGGYCMGVSQAPGRAVIKHCYLYYGSKHNLGIVQGAAGDDLLVEDVQAEQGSPYAGAGGQTVFVSFNHQPLDLGIVHRFHRCRCVANAGVIGSTEGTMTSYYPVFYAHNLGNQPDQFERFEFIDCDFGAGNVQGGAVKSVQFERTRCGSVAMGSNVTANRCTFEGTNRTYSGWSLVERNCVHLISGQLATSPIGGTVDIQGCTFDARLITNIQGGVPQASLFTREEPLTLTFKNNLVMMPAGAVQANVFATLRSTDTIQMSHNAYSLGGNTLVYQYHDGVSAQNRTLPQWQALAYDAESFESSSLDLDGLRPLPGSPVIDEGQDIGPLQDYSGKLFQHRNDIGAYELPAATFHEWQSENFTPAELADPAKSSANASYANDDLPNLMKYALGLMASEPRLEPVQMVLQAPAVLRVLYRRSRRPTDLSLVFKSSTDLLNWSPAQIVKEDILNQTGQNETVLTTLLCPQKDRTFIRLEAALDKLPPFTFTFDDWRSENFTPAELADPAKSSANASYANDRMPNLMKYGLGLAAAEPCIEPVQVSPEASAVFQVSYERSRWPTDLALALTTSANLLNWDHAQVLREDILNQTEHKEMVVATILCPLSDHAFVRLEATLAPPPP